MIDKDQVQNVRIKRLKIIFPLIALIIVSLIFFQSINIKSNFLCNLGYGDASKLFKRSPRFEFDEICEIL